jgi:hypothetical protein
MTYHVFGNFGLGAKPVMEKDKDGKDVLVDHGTVIMNVGDVITSEDLKKAGDHVEETMLAAGLIDLPYKCEADVFRDASGKVVGREDPGAIGPCFAKSEIIPMKKAKEMGLVKEAPVPVAAPVVSKPTAPAPVVKTVDKEADTQP